MVTAKWATNIRRSRNMVFSFLADPRNETQWQSDLVESKLLSSGAVGVGSTGCDVRMFMGKTTTTTWQVTEFLPSETMAFKVVSGPMPFEGSFALESIEDGTRVIYRVQARTSGISKLFDPLLSYYVRVRGHKQMKALKAALEAQA